MSQLLNTLRQIARSDSVSLVDGMLRHSQWQLRRLLGRFPCELTISESQLYVDRPGGVAALVNAMGEYDFNNMRLLSVLLARGENTFFDIGANIGAYTLIASECAGARVVSVEPHPRTFALLEENVRRNTRNNVQCLNLALSNRDGYVSLSDLPESAINRVLNDDDVAEKHLHVPCRRLDGVCRELGLHPDFIKIDVEGYEKEVIEGLGALSGAAKLMLIENGEREGVRRVMQSSGYNGPWFCHFRRSVLSQERQARAEDSIYLGKDFVPILRGMNFAIG